MPHGERKEEILDSADRIAKGGKGKGKGKSYLTSLGRVGLKFESELFDEDGHLPLTDVGRGAGGVHQQAEASC